MTPQHEVTGSPKSDSYTLLKNDHKSSLAIVILQGSYSASWLATEQISQDLPFHAIPASLLINSGRPFPFEAIP